MVDALPALFVLCDDRDDDESFFGTGVAAGREEAICFFEKDELSDPCAESVFHPFDVCAIDKVTNYKIA